MTHEVIIITISLILAYLLGSIPSGVITGKKVKGIDIREHGSRNTGATNVFRVVGKGWGLFVLFLDIFKGFLAILCARFLGLEDLPFAWLLLTGIMAILGHSFSIWLSFKGGKGVATSLGVFLGLAFWPTAAAFLIWCGVFAFTRIVSISSLTAALAFPLAVYLLIRGEPRFPLLLSVSLVLLVFIFYSHRANIGRLLRGEEKKLL